MTTIKLRRGTAAEWTTANPILAAGEMGIETDTRKFKFGDGTTPWNTLAYASAEGGGGTGDVTAAGDNYFTGNNTFTGTTKFDNDVSIHGANLEVAGALEAATGNITNLNVPNTLTSSGEINAVAIKSTGIRSDDIQTTTNKKYLTEVDVDNQTIQVVDGKLHANLDELNNKVNNLSGRVTANEADIQNKQDILSDGNGTKVVDNKVDIYQGIGGIQGLNLYQNNGTITKNNDLSITFDNGACGYIFLHNKGTNNDYEIVLHCNYLNKRGSASDSNINGVRCLPQEVVPTSGEGPQGECWFDTYESPFRVVAISSEGSTQAQTVGNINYIKYVIKGTNMTISRSSTGETYTELYTIAISSTYVINVCIANSPWQNDIASKWTNTTLFPDSYILDKTTNTYLMKQGTANDGVAVATSTKYGLVLPDNSTIVSNNGVLSSITPNNMVTTDTEQTITGPKTFDKIVLPNDSTKGIYGGGKPILYRNNTSTNTYLDVTNAEVTNLSADYGCTTGSNSIGGRYDFYTSTGNNLNGFKHDKTNNKIVVGDTTVPLDINATKVLFNSTLARKVDDSTEATIVDSSNVSTYATGLPFPSNRYIDLTLGASGTAYTAPADGYYTLYKVASGSNQFIQLVNSGNDNVSATCITTRSVGNNDFVGCMIPCAKGKKITINYTLGGRTAYFRFCYAEGAQ